MHQGSQHFVLTGGIGSGKSHVAALLAARGWTVIEADQIGHEVLEPTGAAFDAVSQRWPQAMVYGRIDRRALGRLVFESGSELAELEFYTHPAIRSTIVERIAASPDRVILELPILNDWLPDWPRVVVDAPDETRTARLESRGLQTDEIAARMSAQPRRSEWMAAADFVIANGFGSDLEAELDRLESWMTARTE